MRAGSGYVWNNTNAGQLLQYLVDNNQTGNLWGFELGNELNNKAGHCQLRPWSQAEALGMLHDMLATTIPAAKLIGPDTGGVEPLQWLQGYLPAVRPGILYTVTNHIYNGLERKNYNNYSQLDKNLVDIAWYTNVTSVLYPAAQVWGGEMGPMGGGDDGSCGSDATCGTYATTMWYADDMAQRAKHGFAQYQRHDFFGGAYCLTNSVTGAMALGPTDALVLRPDYWINFLWKRTLGTSVFNASSSDPNVRAYAFAGTPPSPFAAAQCTGSPLQLLLINLDANNSATVSLPAAPSSTDGDAASRSGSSGASSYAAWSVTAQQGQGPFTTLSAINDQTTATTVDVSKVDPFTFLSGITQPAVTGTVTAGVTLPPISTTFLCYY